MISIPLRMEIPIFRLMGKAHYLISARARKVLLANLRRAFGGEKNQREYRGIARRYLENHYVERMAVFLFPKLNTGNIGKYHSIEGWERVEQGLARGKGCILAHAHFGAVHLPLFHIGLMGYNIKQVGLLLPPREASNLGMRVIRMRKHYEDMIPAEIIPANSFLRPIFHCLQKDGIIMMPTDTASDGRGVEHFPRLELMGQYIPFPTGAVALALKSKAALFPIFTIKDGCCRYKTIIEQEIQLEMTDDISQKESYNRNMAKLVSLFAKYLKRYPCHWAFWDEFHPGSLIAGDENKGHPKSNELKGNNNE